MAIHMPQFKENYLKFHTIPIPREESKQQDEVPC